MVVARILAATMWGNYDDGRTMKTQFGKKQFWFVNDYFCGQPKAFGQSYQTNVMYIDYEKRLILLGALARGYSQTTSRQVTQAIRELERKYGGCWDVVNYGDYNRADYNLPERWDLFNYAERF